MVGEAPGAVTLALPAELWEGWGDAAAEVFAQARDGGAHLLRAGARAAGGAGGAGVQVVVPRASPCGAQAAGAVPGVCSFEIAGAGGAAGRVRRLVVVEGGAAQPEGAAA